MRTTLLINGELVAGGGESRINNPKMEPMPTTGAPGTGIAAARNASNRIRHAMIAQ